MSATISPDARTVAGRRGGLTDLSGREERYGLPLSAPERSIEQRMAALERANDVRSRRSRLKRNIAGGHVSVLDVIADPPDWALTMKLLDLLLAAPKVGRVKALKLVNVCRISPTKTLGGLSARQRDEVTAAWIWRRTG